MRKWGDSKEYLMKIKMIEKACTQAGKKEESSKTEKPKKGVRK